MDQLPLTSKELIEWLDQSNPHRCLGQNEDISRHHRYAGKRELIDSLLVALEYTLNLDAFEGRNRTPAAPPLY